MFTATIHFTQQRECILRELTTDIDTPVPIEIEEIRNGSVTFVLRAGGHADTFQATLKSADHVEYVDRLDDTNLLVTKPSCGAYSAIYQNHGTLRRSNTVSGRHREYNILVFRREDLKAIIDDLEQFGTVTLGKLEEFTETTESPLTDRQRDVVSKALARGYYEWPRQINNEDLADELEISRTTLHEHLRRAEQKLVSMGLTNESQPPDETQPDSATSDPLGRGPSE